MPCQTSAGSTTSSRATAQPIGRSGNSRMRGHQCQRCSGLKSVDRIDVSARAAGPVFHDDGLRAIAAR